MIALEAILVHEDDFVSRRLRERATVLLKQTYKHDVKQLLNKYYGFRSTLAHGVDISSSKDIGFIKSTYKEFEQIFRDIFKKVVRQCFAQKTTREKFLNDLFDITDEDSANKIIEDYNSIKDTNVKKTLIKKLRNTSF